MAEEKKHLVEGRILGCDDWIVCEVSKRFRVYVKEPVKKNLKKKFSAEGYDFRSACDCSVLEIDAVDGSPVQ